MAKVKTLATCPACDSELIPESKGICGSCGFVVESLPNPIFGGPSYIDIQKAEKIMELETTPEGPSKSKAFADIEKAFTEWAKGCSDEDRLSAMQDALHLLRYAVTSRASPETIKRMTALGKVIGKISESIEGYAKAGGDFNGQRLLKPAEPTDGGEGMQ